MIRYRAAHFIAVFGTLLLDQVTKHAVDRALPLYGSITVIPGFFNLVHVRNPGIAFGMLNRPGYDFFPYILAAAGITAILVLAFWYFYRCEGRELSVSAGICLMIGGAAGNLVDRVRLGEVIDFIHLYVGSFHWPAFNVADSAITVGAFLVALGILRSGKD